MWRHADRLDEWAMGMLGAWLRDWRIETGATQRQLSQLAGVDQAHICRIELGQRRPSGVPLARIVIALDWLSTDRGLDGPWDRLDVRPPERATRWGPDRPPVVVGRRPLRPSAAVDPGRLLELLLGETEAVADPIDPHDPRLHPSRVPTSVGADDPEARAAA